MSQKIISEYSRFVIFLSLALLTGAACSHTPSQSDSKSFRKLSIDYGDAVVLGRISAPDITESSGLVSSRCQENVFWTHNDSGDKNFIFALNEKGALLGKWSVTGARNRDWEDIGILKDSSGKCVLFVGDIGNNGRTRGTLQIYRFPEPVVAKKQGGLLTTGKADVIRFSYSDLRHDAEALFVHPKTEDIYVITKRVSGAAGVYKLVDGSETARKIADIDLPSVPNGLITGADISPDGTRVIVCDYFGGYEFVLTENAEDFDEIWKTKIRLVDLGVRDQGEAVAYSADGLSVYATSEHSNAPFIRTSRKVED